MTLHPIVAQVSPSPEQEPAIQARARDVVVTAGAGTGKTRTLVARYLALLAEGVPLRAVVAITFTRKAAREMRNRVRDEVRRYLDRSNLDAPERQRWQEIYRQLDAARIGTIHSLCAEILHSHPAEAGIDPRFEVLEEGQTGLRQSQAIDEALAWAANDQQAVVLFGLLGEQGLRAALATMVRQRLEVADCFDSLPESPWSKWEPLLVAPIRAFVDDRTVQDAFADLLALRADGTLARAEAVGDKLAAPLACLLTVWDEMLAARRQEDWPAVSVRLAGLRDTMKQVGRADNWKPANPKLIIKELQEQYDRQLAGWVGKTGINLLLDRKMADLQAVLRRVFDYVLEVYRQLKQERHALDFDDLEHDALALLQRDAAVRARWLAEVQAILVDEFQDTNGRQRDLVRLLNGQGGKLFIVGDAKQSIYRFRGADVTVFRAERERTEQEGGIAVSLKTSYRAHCELVQGLNDLLRPVLGEQADPERPWVEPFAALECHRQRPGPGFAAPHLELHLTVGSKKSGALERAAHALAGRIVALVEGGTHRIVTGDQVRPLDYGDIAILCRASTSFGAYEDALEGAGVPFLTVAGRGFYGRPEIRDLLNALQALADLSDDLALAGLLRSPAFALSDEALYRLVQARDGITGATSLWDLARGDAGSQLPGQDGRRAERAAHLIAALHDRVGRSSIADVLKDFLDATDYRAALIRDGQGRAARNVAKLLADAHASGMVGVGEFLEYIGGLRESGAREGEAHATVEGAVQIMSVHAAKGLEFPVVVIGDVSYGGGRGGDSTLVDPILGVLLPLQDEQGRQPASYSVARVRSDDQEDSESDRLLYVAATRTREKLILSGHISLKADSTVGQPAGWLGKLAAPLALTDSHIDHDEEGAGLIPLDLQAGGTPVACTIYEPKWTWSQHPQQAAVQGEQPTPLPPPLLAPIYPAEERMDRRMAGQDRVPPQRVWRVVPAVARPRAPAWVVGSLVHAALAAWRFPGDSAPGRHGDFAAGTSRGAQEQAGDSLDRWLEARARGYGLTDRRQLDDAIRESRRLLLRFQAHALHTEMAASERRLHEVPYSLEVDGRIESGIIDAICLRGGSWTIVEFKTDRVASQVELDTLLADEDYLPQSRRYVAAAEHLLGQRPQCILCLLNCAGAVHLERL